MTKAFVFCLMGLLLTGCVAENDPKESDLNVLIAAERSFAQASVADGMRTSFLSFLADSAIIFRPTPVLGRVWFSERPEASGTLNWWPRYADVSSAGDLGYTTGPWIYSDSTGTPVAHGHYVSVWKAAAPGIWKIAFDAGITHHQSIPFDSTVAHPDVDRSTRSEEAVDLSKARSSLLRAEQDLIGYLKTVSQDWEAARARWADDIRGYRESRLPVLGKPEVLALMGNEADSLIWVPIASDLSNAGDFGYSYGTVQVGSRVADQAPHEVGGYLRIWRRQASGDWVVVLDLASAFP